MDPFTGLQEADSPAGQGERGEAEAGVQVLQGVYEGAGRQQACW